MRGGLASVRWVWKVIGDLGKSSSRGVVAEKPNCSGTEALSGTEKQRPSLEVPGKAAWAVERRGAGEGEKGRY